MESAIAQKSYRNDEYNRALVEVMGRYPIGIRQFGVAALGNGGPPEGATFHRNEGYTEWRPLGMAAPRNGGPSEWRPLGMADPNQCVR